jgi:hypothetical protein
LGLKVNFNKSMLFGVNVNESWLHEVASVMSCKHGRLPFLYLGLPIGGDPRKIQFWYPLIDRIRNWLSGWKCKNLSLGGQLVLLKSVLSSVPVYFLSFFKAPSGIISSLDSIFSNFFWWEGEDVRKISWIKWDNICLNKENGGLGVKRLKEFNISLLGKWVWRLLEDRESLWNVVIRAKYGEEGGRVRFGEGVGSVWWRNLNQIRRGVGLVDSGWLSDNIIRRVGDGRDTLFWVDPWLDDCPLARTFGRLYYLADNKLVTVSEMFELGWRVGGEVWKWRRRLLAWEEGLVSECTERVSSCILQVGTLDRWVWKLHTSQCYTVKSAYSFLTTTDTNLNEDYDSFLWLKAIPLKVNLFVWRLFLNRLPTKDNLFRRKAIDATKLPCEAMCG